MNIEELKELLETKAERLETENSSKRRCFMTNLVQRRRQLM